MSKIVELFGHSAYEVSILWPQVVNEQLCNYTGRRCYKIRKSSPEISIGTCTVLYGRDPLPVIICPTRLLERRQVFVDCIHLLTQHEPGNELHIVSEVPIPGGHVDFFLVSVRDGIARDFVGIELQTLDTTGTVWPERQRFVAEHGVAPNDEGAVSANTFGMNWKMTAKTILVQMHHKVQTFEHLSKKLVLVVQNNLLSYMRREFTFSHMSNPARIGDAMHMHAYQMIGQPDSSFSIQLSERISTDADGIARCLGLQAEARVELQQIIYAIQSRLSLYTRFTPF